MDALLKQGIPIEFKGNFFATPLVWASYSGETDAVRLLVKRGADLQVAGFDGGTSLHELMMKGDEEIALFLLDQNVDVKGVRTGSRLSWRQWIRVIILPCNFSWKREEIIRLRTMVEVQLCMWLP